MDGFRKSGGGDGEERKIKIRTFSRPFKRFFAECATGSNHEAGAGSWNCAAQAWLSLMSGDNLW